MYYKCYSINDMILDVGSDLMKWGGDIDSRNGKCKELYDTDVIISNPQARNLCIPGRKNNIFATVAEVFWVLADYDNGALAPFLTFFLRRAVDYSDDGITWPDYYGTRIWRNDQIGNILDMFCQDGINTRRAVMTIWRPDMDTTSVRGPEKSKAIPCSQWLGFWVRDGRFYSKFQMRSNDIIFGTTINVAEFTVLQEIIMRLLENVLEIDLELGYFHYSSISTHIYEPYYKQMYDILDHERDNMAQPAPRDSIDSIILGSINDSDTLKSFIRDIYSILLNDVIERADVTGETILEVFTRYNVPTANNILYQYAIMVEDYISYRKNGVGIYNLDEILCDNLKYCIKNSPFKPEGMNI